MVGYSRDDFEVPVEDYDFSRVTDVGSLIDQMSQLVVSLHRSWLKPEIS